MKKEKEVFTKVPYEVMYGLRFLLFHEESPQSNEYRQVLLEEKDYKKLVALLKKSVHMSKDTFLLPDLRERL